MQSKGVRCYMLVNTVHMIDCLINDYREIYMLFFLFWVSGNLGGRKLHLILSITCNFKVISDSHWILGPIQWVSMTMFSVVYPVFSGSGEKLVIRQVDGWWLDPQPLKSSRWSALEQIQNVKLLPFKHCWCISESVNGIAPPAYKCGSGRMLTCSVKCFNCVQTVCI